MAKALSKHDKVIGRVKRLNPAQIPYLSGSTGVSIERLNRIKAGTERKLDEATVEKLWAAFGP